MNLQCSCAGFVPSARAKLEAGREGEQGDIARLLDGEREATLVAGADAGQTARHDLATLCDEALKETDIAVGDGVDLLCAELADLLAAEELASSGTAARTAGGTTAGTARASGSACWAGVRGT